MADLIAVQKTAQWQKLTLSLDGVREVVNQLLPNPLMIPFCESER